MTSAQPLATSHGQRERRPAPPPNPESGGTFSFTVESAFFPPP
jgi:hypothetical protein